MTRGEAAGAARTIPRASIVVAALSTMVEWYDFTLYLYFATVLARLFFGDAGGALAATLGGFAVAYLIRPLGAAVFGHFGDRHGRRVTMLASMALMTLASLATALLPTREAIGPAAGWGLILLRCLMGFSVGGEYTGVIAYLLEGAAPHRRGLVTAMAVMASEVGALLAAGVAALTVTLLDEGDLAAWGWRIPFLVGAALAGAVLVARATIVESPAFLDDRAAGTLAARPLVEALRHHRPAVGRGFAISALGSITYYVGITYVPAFLTGIGRTSEAGALWLSTAAALVVIAVTPLIAVAGDRHGRRLPLLLLCGAAAVLPVAMFALMASGAAAGPLLGSVVLAAVGGGVSAVGTVATAEHFPARARLSGLALGATAATAVFGGMAPWVAQRLIDATGSPLVPGLMIAVVAAVVLPVLLRMPETAPLPRAGGGRTN